MDYKTEIGIKFIEDADEIYVRFKNDLLKYLSKYNNKSTPEFTRLSKERILATDAARACELYLKGILLPSYSIKDDLVDSNLISEITVKQEVELILGNKTPQEILQEVNAIKQSKNEPQIALQKGEHKRIKDQSLNKKFSHNLYTLIQRLPNVSSIIRDNDFKEYAINLGITQTNSQDFLEIFFRKMIDDRTIRDAFIEGRYPTANNDYIPNLEGLTYLLDGIRKTVKISYPNIVDLQYYDKEKQKSFFGHIFPDEYSKIYQYTFEGRECRVCSIYDATQINLNYFENKIICEKRTNYKI